MIATSDTFGALFIKLPACNPVKRDPFVLIWGRIEMFIHAHTSCSISIL